MPIATRPTSPPKRSPRPDVPIDRTEPRTERRIVPREIKQVTPRIVIDAVEGFGKTTMGAYAPDPFILMSRGETGYDTLLASGLVPQVPAEEIMDWSDLLGWVEALANDVQGRKTLVLDTLDGFERLCHEHVCRRDFGGDWTEKGFASYSVGYKLSVTDWLGLLSRLDRIRAKGVTILWLGHARVQTFKNPLGPDFDRYVCDCHSYTWSATHKWVDAVLFGNFLTVIDNEQKAKKRDKGKAIGGTDRVLYTERRDSYDAKNRFGMPSKIWLEDGPSASWSILASYLQQGT